MPRAFPKSCGLEVRPTASRVLRVKQRPRGAQSTAPAPATTTPTPATGLGLRRYLYFTAAIAGAAIMIVEILGAKMLSPFIGMSHFVWTAQIAVTLVALSVGYYVGGRLSDRTQNLSSLYWALVGAAIYLSLSVLICRPVAFWCLDFNLPVGSLLASLFLFFVPLALMATTGPFLIRILTSSVTGVGGNMGRLTAVSTLGSFGGTILIGYLMIPFLPNSVTMYLTAGVLLVTAAGYFVVFHRRVPVPLVVVCALVGLGGWGVQLGLHPKKQAFAEQFSGNSNFGQLQVFDLKPNPARSTYPLRLYLNDFLVQNTYDTERKQSEATFTYMLSGLARAYRTNLNDVLCIGMGVGIVPMDFARSGAHVDVVEINPAVVPVARKYFDCDPSLLNLTIDDGRHYLNRCSKQYDAIVLDAFLGDSSPSHLLTREAFQAMHRVLRTNGILTINIFGHLETDRDFLTASLKNTLRTVFRNVAIHTSDESSQFFFAASDMDPMKFARNPDLSVIHPIVRDPVAHGFRTVVDTYPDHGMVLTDNYNPVEFWDARNREETRKKLVTMVRDL